MAKPKEICADRQMFKVSRCREPLQLCDCPFDQDGMPMRCGSKRGQLFCGAVHHLPHSINVVVHLWLAVCSDSDINRRALSWRNERRREMRNSIALKKLHEQILVV